MVFCSRRDKCGIADLKKKSTRATGVPGDPLEPENGGFTQLSSPRVGPPIATIEHFDMPSPPPPARVPPSSAGEKPPPSSVLTSPSPEKVIQQLRRNRKVALAALATALVVVTVLTALLSALYLRCHSAHVHHQQQLHKSSVGDTAHYRHEKKYVSLDRELSDEPESYYGSPRLSRPPKTHEPFLQKPLPNYRRTSTVIPARTTTVTTTTTTTDATSSIAGSKISGENHVAARLSPLRPPYKFSNGHQAGDDVADDEQTKKFHRNIYRLSRSNKH